ncbi:hypothetical protein L905_26185 [Agrobacterium sp. TS43]|nr:hypothetical protein K538_20020 [Agrobacterium tumefaciens GW4]KVK43686.1 hypothetical protein L904_26965 [Agrobacterium sp. LY4]KVK43720.1 hypothetical protein L903_26990 [Agrobacterium sp. JL28]KVK54813.1 hypothetical protein L905_26185 [Agrobacterium sp. TS43]KVK57916.1 hypothetical protein L906_26890 [Agrobacterium sp. TS45]KVK61078.1 hypothetical protein L907_26735 [Agrobacterium sp. C13]
MTGAKESKPEGERGEGFEKGFCADTSNRDRQEQGRRGFLMLAMSLRRKRFAGRGLRVDVESMRATRGIFQPSFLCLSQESSRRASARRKESLQPKDLG